MKPKRKRDDKRRKRVRARTTTRGMATIVKGISHPRLDILSFPATALQNHRPKGLESPCPRLKNIILKTSSEKRSQLCGHHLWLYLDISLIMEPLQNAGVIAIEGLEHRSRDELGMQRVVV